MVLSDAGRVFPPEIVDDGTLGAEGPEAVVTEAVLDALAIGPATFGPGIAGGTLALIPPIPTDPGSFGIGEVPEGNDCCLTCCC